MIKGHPAYTSFGILKKDEVKSKRRVKLVGQAEYVDSRELGREGETVWSEDIWDFTGRNDIEDIQFVLAYKAPSAEATKAYGTLSKDDIEFGVRVWNKSTRRRSWHQGDVAYNTTGNLTTTFDSASNLPITLSRFSGEIEIQPLVVSRYEGLRDNSRRFTLPKGTILGWSDPIVIVTERRRAGLAELFDIQWKNFSDFGEGTDEQYFRIQWTEQPILYLNLETENLNEVMMSNAPTGKAARARDMINASIAQEALSSVLTAAIAEFHEKQKDGEPSPESILGNLSRQNSMVLRSWGWTLTEHGRVARADEVVSELMDIDSERMQDIITGELPSRLQTALSSEKAVEELLKELVSGGNTNGN